MILYCPDCNSKIRDKHYDAEFEMYECPGCEGLFMLDELTRQGKERAAGGSEKPGKAAPVAKGKKRQEAIERDEQASEEQIAEIMSNVKETAKETKHRDEIETGLVLNIMADEIEAIAEELGISIDRLNAREFYAMNLYRPLLLAGVRAREQDVLHRLCKEHS